MDAPWAEELALVSRLVEMSDEELGRQDIAAVNLACSVGLPGPEDLDIPACLRKLEEWAGIVQHYTMRHWHTFLDAPREYDHSPGQFRMLALITVLQRHLGVTYRPDLIHGEYDASHALPWFIHGPLSGYGGTCVSLPVLYIAVGRRLGYPLKLVQAKEHCFARWDEPGGERFNVEGSGRGFGSYPDEHYHHWPQPLTGPELAKGLFLRSLTPRQELAVFLHQRFCCWRDNLRSTEALIAARAAFQADPQGSGMHGGWMVCTLAFRILTRLRQQHIPADMSLDEALLLATPQPNAPWHPWASQHARQELARIAANRQRKALDRAHASVFETTSAQPAVFETVRPSFPLAGTCATATVEVPVSAAIDQIFLEESSCTPPISAAS